MATLSVTVPNPLIPDLTTAVNLRAVRAGVDISAMTATQKGQWLVAELLKDEVIRVRTDAARATAAAAIAANQATELAAQQQARLDVASITG